MFCLQEKITCRKWRKMSLSRYVWLCSGSSIKWVLILSSQKCCEEKWATNIKSLTRYCTTLTNTCMLSLVFFPQWKKWLTHDQVIEIIRIWMNGRENIYIINVMPHVFFQSTYSGQTHFLSLSAVGSMNRISRYYFQWF